MGSFKADRMGLAHAMMEKPVNGLPTPLTAAEAVAVAPESFKDQETVETVQLGLKELGYNDIGEIDGKLGKLTEDEILAFRARNNLPLVPVIDRQLIDTMASAPAKEIPERQATATAKDVSERVEAVKTVEAVKRVSWWGKFTAWIFGLGPVVISIATAIIDNFDEAIAAVMPVRNMFSELPIFVYLLGFSAIAAIFGYQQYRIAKLSNQAESELVEGYRVGTVKNDAITNSEGKPNGAKLS